MLAAGQVVVLGAEHGQRDEAIRAKAELIVRQWTWETLAVPEYASGAQLYWSSEVRSLVREFIGISGRFTMRATGCLRLSEERPQAVREARGNLWGQCSKDRAGAPIPGRGC